MLSGVVARLRSLWRGVRRGSALRAEMEEEFRLHMELRAADLGRAGLSPAEAARRARLEFGSVERYTDEGRASRGLRRVDQLRVSWLDFKLGFRMLAKYPGLTVVGGLAIAVAVAAGAGAFEFITQVVHPRLPLPEGERVVAVRLWDAARSRVDGRSLREFVAWRAELTSVRELGAYRTVERNLVGRDLTPGAPVVVAEISASAFRIAHAAPLLGRPLSSADEEPSAPPAVVIGYDLWRTRFASDSAVVGRTLRLGDAQYTVVGVMRDGFAFPTYHDAWVPLRVAPGSDPQDRGPQLTMVFGRLAPGATLEAAQAELNTLARRHAADYESTRADLRPQVMPFAQATGMVLTYWPQSLVLISVNLFVVMLLVLVFGNVALLMFARAATREGEIVVRSALGASRARIITQLFAEALVLAGVGAVVGVMVARATLRWGFSLIQADGDRLPFWMHDTLSPATVLYAALLTLLGAAIAGVVPGLKVTRGLQSRLRQAAAGAGGLRFGGVWTAVIVAQVAVTVAFPVTAFFARRDAVQVRSLDVGVPAREYLTAQLQMDREGSLGVTDTAGLPARFRAAAAELERRLEGTPGVVGVTFASRLPSEDHEQRRIEVEGLALPRDTSAVPSVSSVSAAPDYLPTMGAPVLAGRGFLPGDLAPGARAVIVNRSFVRHVLGGGNPIGRRVRYLDPADPDEPRPAGWQPSPWYEIVGVAKDLGMTDGSDPHESGAGIYHPSAPGAAAARLLVHVTADPRALTPRLRAVALSVDPTLRLDRVMPLEAIPAAGLRQTDFWVRLLATVSAVALLLSLAGVYAVTSFAVARRTREIGVRVALGADARRVVAAIFARPLAQVGAGVLAGTGLVSLLVRAVIGSLSPAEAALVAAYAALMMGVCMLACVVPTRRALRVQPTEALRSDG